ncbi:MAG TPA: ATPase, T2SS/T4P/T4SS family, partial [Gemmataceae bacterium]|nr:ATPase, T2SS/T4P/T4SS family [Gemmataceae bacterium]
MTSPVTSQTSLAELLAECVRQDASDVHLAPGLVPYFRIHGLLQPHDKFPIQSPADTEALGTELGRNFNRSSLEKTGSLDGAVSAADGTRFRFNVFRRQGEFAIALRRLEDRFRSLGELGFPESLYELCDLPDGLIVFSGPTGAGKSTTLASLLDRINRDRRCHIVTIEDPIEYIHTPVL